MGGQGLTTLNLCVSKGLQRGTTQSTKQGAQRLTT